MADIFQSTLRSFAFGPYTLLPERQALLKDDAPVRIGGRALDMLTALVERPGEVVSKADLIARAWPETFVDESNLKVNMAVLRRALGDDADAPRFIATVSGRGYRFVAPVRRSASRNPEGEVAATSKGNLPNAAVRIVGRAQAIASIHRDLTQSRLVSIVGPGGVGKTTVALAVAELELGSPRDGVWLVELASLKDPALVPNAIATALGMSAHSASMLAAVSDFLRDREVLLVFDNCEHIIDAASSCVGRILAEAVGVTILATSREPLGVKGERVRRMPALDAPPASPDITATEALAFPAVQLFVERATDRSESFDLNDADAPVVSEICRRLEGLPLAIELAATRVDAFGPTELLGLLKDRFEVLTTQRTGPERHQTLKATIDWSYDLLSAREQSTMRYLSMFAGDFSLSSACAVAPGDRLEVVEDMANLVAKSLVAVERRDGEAGYHLLDLTRSYALEKLRASGELDLARRRHAEHVLDLAQQANALAVRLSASEWVQRYRSRLDDIRDALAWAFSDAHDPALAVRLTVAAIPFWEALFLLEECRGAAERALEGRFRNLLSPREELALSQALAASQLFTRGPDLRVKTLLTRALELAEQVEDTDRQQECLDGLSEFYIWTGDARAALEVADRGRAIAAARNAADARDTGGSEIARPSRFEVDPKLTDRGSLAVVLWLQGFPDQAVETARRQRQEAKASAYPALLCAVLNASITVCLLVGDLDGARHLLDVSDRYATEHRLPIWIANNTCMRGKLRLDSGEPFDLSEYCAALKDLREGGFLMWSPSHIANHGHGLLSHGDYQGALEKMDEALELSTANGEIWGIPEQLRMKGDFIRAASGPNANEIAADHYLRSIELARQQGALSWELRGAMSLVELHRGTGDEAAAKARLSEVYGRFTEGFDTVGLRQARALLAT